ncbi:thymidine phosphorylase [Paracoccus sp. (in: a-proteobacteria)]|uniref:thymidine phosphorylase n=1 Tax=Paracoccus sp. TaxID=267 RepID=UPI0026E10386|nr:thymidine phosphorylase [Paracoccus sp. (in: a-proteobacteria)]MDO5648055.1 thymidine phosphorylase [Paracoccus sp. (in: a-proteobacteria)]
MTDARSIIAAIRDGRGLNATDAAWFARGLADGAVDDAQAGAFAMAVLLRGIGADGRVALTQAMRDSGSVLSWDMPGPIVDKHSTGGVGDSVSLILAPALAACGAYVPMISGRGLGHTGGTLDKMEAIPGYNALIDKPDLDRALTRAGCAIVGATGDIAPADRRLYGIRDVTATVESIDLITPSILSKKLAAGLGALILDVKFGSGAFMTDRAQAQDLARALVQTANGAGCRTAALLTDMNSPLARTAGNAIEVAEVIALLRDPDDSPLIQVTVALGAQALMLAGLAADAADGAAQIRAAIDTGAAADRFGRMVATLGGPADVLTDAGLTIAPAVDGPPVTGWVAAIDTRAVGELVVRMGGGRLRVTDLVDHSVGLSGLARVGDHLDARAVGQVHLADADRARDVARQLTQCYTISPDPLTPAPLVFDHIGG